MALADELTRIAAAAAGFAAENEELRGVLATETGAGLIYLCAFESPSSRNWLALGEDAQPVRDRQLVRDAASLAALCEVAEESAGGGDLPQLRARLAELRETERPPGIEDAERAAAWLSELLQPEPRIASHAYLDAIGAASRWLEQALGESGGSPFAAAMQSALGVVEELTADIERQYKVPLT
jgi:hypothetical protein